MPLNLFFKIISQEKYFIRSVHEAYQFLVQTLKKKSGRSMQENWTLGRRKSVAVGLLNKKEVKEEEEEEEVRPRSFSLSNVLDTNTKS